MQFGASIVTTVRPQTPVDDFLPPWDHFEEFFFQREDLEREFLVELNHDTGTRQVWTVGAWRNRISGTAAWLADQGVKPTHTVATLAGNSADALAVAYGCWVLGACVVPLNPGDSRGRQEFILQDAAVSMLVFGEAARLLAGELCDATGARAVPTSRLPRGDDDRDHSAEARSSAMADEPAAGLDRPAVRVYTSGTTGDPKAVVLTAANLLVDCDGLALSLNWPEETRVITVLPIHHVNGLVISSLLPWYAGLSTVLCDRFRSDSFWADVEREGATVCSVVPSLLEFLLAVPQSPPSHFSEFLCGAGPLLVETALNSERIFSVPIRHLYGLSETTAVLTLMPTMSVFERSHWHRDYGFPSIGPTLPHVDVAILDESGNTLGAGARGELAARGAVVMNGYASDVAASDAAFHGGWFHTGDEGFWEPGPNDSMFFFITGRIKELIIRGGTNISPLEIDSVLRSAPGVDFALAVPFENRFYGEEIAAYVVGSSELTEDVVLAHCSRFLDFSRCPKVIVFGDDVPYTATGKAKRLELKTQLAPELRKYRDVQFRRSALAGGS
jgi:long-chain acyl-CoA synthetase